MNANVGVERGGAVETFAASFALKIDSSLSIAYTRIWFRWIKIAYPMRFLLGVDDLVPTEGGRLTKRFSTHLYAKRLD